MNSNVRTLCKLLGKIALLDYAVVYIDPPYATAETSAYRYPDIDTHRMGAAIMAQKGNVAISGYADEWDFLGWNRHEMDVAWLGVNRVNGVPHAPAGRWAEVLWTSWTSLPGSRS